MHHAHAHMLAHAGASGPGSSVGGADALSKVEEELKEVAAEMKRACAEANKVILAAKPVPKLFEHAQKHYDYLLARQGRLETLLNTRRDLIAKLPNSAGGCCKRCFIISLMLHVGHRMEPCLAGCVVQALLRCSKCCACACALALRVVWLRPR
jgi:hypothetical protein